MRKTIIFLITTLLLPITATAEIFQWRDSQGGQHFSDRAEAGAEIIAIDPGYSFHIVKYVYDGDTVQLSDGRKIRLLGINTPEIEGRNKTAEAGGIEAKRWLTEALRNVRVRLVTDSEKKDKFGRTLAHVFTDQKRHVNLELVKAGLAAVNIYPPNLLYADALVAAQNDAEAASLGIWGRTDYAPLSAGQISSHHHKGWRRITGQVKGLRNTRKFVYLKFNPQFDIRVERSNLKLFPDLNDYIGQKIEVRGWLNRTKKHFSMLIRHPSAIKALTDSKNLTDSETK
ncbi:MAG: nuclease [Gammaproteobacteria bacterium HGW-Gammaproteobacteria-3]|nr:MAG: nuclease [Gammaproteobacteria bacterium HGW-Gammaproteobacteria-3]